jgi:hypothetical protein
MKQVNNIHITTPAEPTTDLSPEFLEWLHKEKADSYRRVSAIQATVLIILGTTFFLIKQQPDWFSDIFGLIQTVIHP